MPTSRPPTQRRCRTSDPVNHGGCASDARGKPMPRHVLATPGRTRSRRAQPHDWTTTRGRLICELPPNRNGRGTQDPDDTSCRMSRIRGQTSRLLRQVNLRVTGLERHQPGSMLQHPKRIQHLATRAAQGDPDVRGLLRRKPVPMAPQRRSTCRYTISHFGANRGSLGYLGRGGYL